MFNTPYSSPGSDGAPLRVDQPGGFSATPVDGEHTEARAVALWLTRIAKWTIFAVLFLGPLFLLPFTQDALLAKVVLLGMAAAVAVTAWLFSALSARQLTYTRSPLNVVWLALAVSLIAATVFASAPWTSLWGPDLTGEKTATILSLLALSFVAAAVFRRRDALMASAILMASFFLLGAWALGAIFLGRGGASLPVWFSSGPAGTVPALAMVLATGFLFSLVFAMTAVASSGRRVLGRELRYLALATSLVLFAALLLVGFPIVWIGIGAVMALAIIANFISSWQRPDGSQEHSFGATAVGIAFLLVVLSAYLSFRPIPVLTRFYQTPVEVSPTIGESLETGREVLFSKRILGVGPGNFAAADNQFRDAARNGTPFWQVRFAHASSFLATIPATVGVVGAVAFLAFIVSSMVMIGRAVGRARSSEPLLWAISAGSVFILIGWFLYASNVTSNFLLFLFLGLLTAALRDRVPAPAAEAGSARGDSWWGVWPRQISLEAPATNFVAAMAVVFAAAFSAVALYGLGALYAAEVYATRAARALNDFGNIDTAQALIVRATGLNPTEESYFRAHVQLSTLAVRRIISGLDQNQNPDQDLATRFRDEFSRGESAGQRATALAPQNPLNWISLGQLYETVMPYATGLEEAALAAYRQAARADPFNPEIPLARGRTHLTKADILTLQINQTFVGDERSRLETGRREVWAEAREELGEAIRLKADYAAAHFVLAQLAIREGNIGEAIRKAEETAQLVPQDVGVAFQLGVLYYQSGNLDGARGEFERAILFNENYSNARYFLGLVWDRKGDRDAAVSQFQKIAALNPENEEVKRIILNIQSGKPALDGISPPGPAPEARREPPVREPSTKPPSR